MDLFAPSHLILIAFVVLLLFGGKKIPELMRGLGKGVREFNDAKDNVRKELSTDMRDRNEEVRTSTPVNSTPTTPVSSTIIEP